MKKRYYFFILVFLLGFFLFGCTRKYTTSYNPTKPTEPTEKETTKSDEPIVYTYTVTWLNWDYSVLEVDENILYGETPSYNGYTPSRPSADEGRYVFTGWSPIVNMVTEDITFVAQYVYSNGYVIIWKNWDGSVLDINYDVALGSTPYYYGTTPVREEDAGYTYSFSGWSPEICNVTGDATYTAIFTAEPKPIVLNSISFAQNDIYMFVGEKKTFTYTVNPSMYTDAVTIDSYDSSIVRASGNTIFGVTSGETKIIGYGPDGTKSTFNVYVIEKMQLSYAFIYQLYGYVPTVTTAVVNLKNYLNYYDDYTVTTKSAYHLKFYSQDQDYFEVDEISGKVTCKNKVGIAKCKVVLYSPISSYEFTMNIGIRKEILVTGWTFEKNQFTIKVGDTAYINGNCTPSDANLGALTYESSDNTIASVDSNGYITAKNVGNCEITAYCKTLDEYYHFQVSVSGIYATTISTTSSAISVGCGETKKIAYTYGPSNANVGKKVTFFSDNEEVAIVDDEGNITGIDNGTCKVIATLENEYKLVINVTVVQGINPTSVSLESITIKTSTSTNLTATISPSNANINTKITWESSNTNVASVVNGRLRAYSPGEAVITATLQNGVSGQCTVTVIDYIRPTSVSLSKDSVVMDPTTTITLTATINPTDAERDKTLTWSSSNETIATVNASTGLITAIKPGTCTITVKTANNKTASCSVIVNDYTYPTSITFNPTSMSVEPNRTGVITAIFTPLNANGGLDITWNSSNSSVAKVDNGVVTGVRPGTCTITGTLSNGMYATCSITVTNYIYAESLTLSKTTMSINMEKTDYLTASYSPSTANTGTNITFSSSNSSIATVDNSGIITAVGIGTCTITASLENGYSKTCSVTVNDYIYATSFSLTSSKTMNIYEYFKLTVSSISPTNYQKGDTITWKTSNSSIATVDENGVVHATGVGNCTITATLEKGYSRTCSITVSDLSPIIFNANTRENYSNSLYVNCTEGQVIPLESNTVVTYSSTNSSIAYVDSNRYLRCVGTGKCVIKATNKSGSYSEIEIRVYNCSIISNQNRIDNYKNGEIISEFDVYVYDYDFIDGKNLNITLSAEKISGLFEKGYIALEIYDSNGILLCTEVVSTSEKVLFYETRLLTKNIDLSYYLENDYTHQFYVSIVDTPFYS